MGLKDSTTYPCPRGVANYYRLKGKAKAPAPTTRHKKTGLTLRKVGRKKQPRIMHAMQKSPGVIALYTGAFLHNVDVLCEVAGHYLLWAVSRFLKTVTDQVID